MDPVSIMVIILTVLFLIGHVFLVLTHRAVLGTLKEIEKGYKREHNSIRSFSGY